jgi:hypothetical protein
MGFRRQADDQVEPVVLKVSERMRLVLCNVDADLVHHGDGEGIGLTGFDASGGDKNLSPEQVPGYALGHW